MKWSFLLVVLHLKLFCLSLAILQNLQSTLTKKSRKLSFIHGSKLTITPELLIPIGDIHSSQSGGPLALVHSTFLMSLPFTVDLGLLGHEFFDFVENGIPLLERNAVQPWWIKYIKNKSERKRKPRSPEDTDPAVDRLVIFGKLETILASVGLPGRECLLRTICEIHEYPHWNAYGIIGELFQTVFRIRRISQPRNALREHLEAQRNGRSGNCSKYATVCSKSLFTTS